MTTATATRTRRHRTDNQERILAALRRHYEATGFPMTVRDLMDACNISSTSVVVYNLDRLSEQGLVSRRPGGAGAIPTGYRVIRENMEERR